MIITDPPQDLILDPGQDQLQGLQQDPLQDRPTTLPQDPQQDRLTTPLQDPLQGLLTIRQQDLQMCQVLGQVISQIHVQRLGQVRHQVVRLRDQPVDPLLCHRVDRRLDLLQVHSEEAEEEDN